MNSTFDAQGYLQNFGIKPSIQRMAIIDYLVHNRIHPTADEIFNALYRSVPTLSKTTVYNTMKLFTEQGAVLSLVIDDKNVRYDVDTSLHAHSQCNHCGKIFDLPIGHTEILEIKQWEGMTITESHLYYRGYCRECKNKMGETH